MIEIIMDLLFVFLGIPIIFLTFIFVGNVGYWCIRYLLVIQKRKNIDIEVIKAIKRELK